MAKKPPGGTKEASEFLPLKTLLKIRANRYRLDNAATGIVQDYDPESVDRRINELSEKKAQQQADEIDKEQKKLYVFKEPSATRIMADHVKEIESLEEKKARKLLARYKQARVELRDRLDVLDYRTFTAQHLRGVLIQVEQAILEMSARLNEDIDDAAMDVSIKGIQHLASEYEQFNEMFTGSTASINVDQAAISAETTNLLANQYETSIQSYSEDVRSRIAMGLTQAAIQELSYSEVIKNLSSFFVQEEWKLHRIVRTELSNVYNLSKMNTMQSLVDTGQAPKLKKTLFNPMDARTADDSRYADLLHLVVDIDEPFIYTYKGKKRKFMAPPDRPNDRSVLIPFSEEW